jgi:hypothetical protein
MNCPMGSGIDSSSWRLLETNNTTTLFKNLYLRSSPVRACGGMGSENRDRAVTWDHGIDLAPDAMYDAIKASGVWVLC